MFAWDRRPLRTLLFAPGSDERKLARLGTFGADVVVIDLEDAVAGDLKVAARSTCRAAIPTYGDGMAVCVRVNGSASGLLEDDIAAVVTPGVDAVMVPKVEHAEDLTVADRALSRGERYAGLADGSVRLLAIIETPPGLVRCERLLSDAPARLHTVVFGSGDFTVSLGIELGRDADELHYARSRIVVAAAAARLAPPIDGPWLRLEDEEGFEADCRRSRQLGFHGRVIVYPPQVALAHRAYSVLEREQAARLRRVVEAFEAAEAAGVASINVDGRFIDYPIYRLACRHLAGYEAWLAEEEGRRRSPSPR